MIQKTKVLVFANLPIQGKKNSLGGATVLTQEIIKYLSKNELLEVKYCLDGDESMSGQNPIYIEY